MLTYLKQGFPTFMMLQNVCNSKDYYYIKKYVHFYQIIYSRTKKSQENKKKVAQKIMTFSLLLISNFSYHSFFIFPFGIVQTFVSFE